MMVYNSIENLPPAAQNCFLAIGNFDGVHRGHQALLAQARAMAQTAGKTLAVLTFEPHPRALLRPDDPPFRLTPGAAKARGLATQGVDHIFSLPFTWDFASQSAEQFIAHILKTGIKPHTIIIGPDFRFGQMRRGTPDMLRAAGLDVHILEKTICAGDQEISSSRIRQALQQGDLDTARDLLGRAWEIEGIVIKGDQRGRTIGYPTANMSLGETIHPAYGVYATLVKIVEDGPDAPWLDAATNIGIRPMFEVAVGQVETYIFDFDRDIYGKTLRVCPVQRLRGEARFDDLDTLVRQIEKDCEAARALLAETDYRT